MCETEHRRVNREIIPGQGNNKFLEKKRYARQISKKKAIGLCVTFVLTNNSEFSRMNCLPAFDLNSYVIAQAKSTVDPRLAYAFLRCIII